MPGLSASSTNASADARYSHKYNNCVGTIWRPSRVFISVTHVQNIGLSGLYVEAGPQLSYNVMSIFHLQNGVAGMNPFRGCACSGRRSESLGARRTQQVLVLGHRICGGISDTRLAWQVSLSAGLPPRAPRGRFLRRAHTCSDDIITSLKVYLWETFVRTLNFLPAAATVCARIPRMLRACG